LGEDRVRWRAFLASAPGSAGAGRNRFLLLPKRSVSHCGRLANVDPCMTPDLSPLEVCGRRYADTETSCLSASEQPFFNFRVAQGEARQAACALEVIEIELKKMDRNV
jgi:hypothetical protein